MVRTACSSMRQNSTSILSGIMVALEKEHQPRHCSDSKGNDNHHLGRHITSRRNRYIVEETTSRISIQEEKGKRSKGNGGKWSSWNEDPAFPYIYIERDGCAG